ncbi:MAG: hypothetical protein ACRDS9_12305 [Pseudonocardiaceae bacterium]
MPSPLWSSERFPGRRWNGSVQQFELQLDVKRHGGGDRAGIGVADVLGEVVAEQRGLVPGRCRRPG